MGGLDIVVYRSKESIDPESALIRAKKDPSTGRYYYYFDSRKPENQIPRNPVVATKLRIGNTWDVVELREDLKQAAGSTGLPLLEWCMRDGTHSGDMIRFDLLDNLEHEIQYLFKTRKVHFYINLYVFLSKMLEAIEIARQEKKPIVFV
jgi:hypothetical protein